MKKQKKLYLAFCYAFALFMVLLAGISLLTHDNPFLALGRVQLLIASLAVGGIVLAARYLWDKKLTLPDKSWRIVLVLFVLYFLAQLFVADKLQVWARGEWDYTRVFREAEERVLRGMVPTDYFGKFPNNVPYYWVLCGFFGLLHLFGVEEFMMPLLVLNMACISGSLLLLYAMARRVTDAKWALWILLLGMLSPALLLYVPIAYTDTLTMPFVCGAAYLWMLARSAHRQADSRKAVRYGVLAGVVAGLGAILKVSVAILVIAFVLDVLLFWDETPRWKTLLATLLCFAVVLGGGNTLAQKAMPDYNFEKIPFTHWIMMGLHGTGSYYDEDYERTLAYDTYEERMEFHKEEIVRRVKEMGPLGFLDHLREKLAFMISDGTYYAPSKLNRAALKPSIWHEFVIEGGKYAGILYYLADGFQICLLLACGWGSWRAARDRQHALTVYRIALFGLVLFLLLWENRSRYLVNFLPLFLLCAGSGMLHSQAEREM